MNQVLTMNDAGEKNFYYKEAVKTLRTNIQFTGKEIKAILFTSCYPNEGKTDIVFQLAVEMGKAGRKTVIVDADIRKSGFIKRYKTSREVPGLSEYLSGQAEKKDIICSTGYDNADIILAGPIAPNPSELLEQGIFGDLIRELKEEYDYVLLDTPPVGSVIDAVVAARSCDGAVLVIESGLVSHKAALKTLKQLQKSGCSILGTVLNKTDIKRDRYYFSYYKKYGEYYKND